MKKHEGINDKIAALSPCIAKAQEFTDTHLVEYNVTFKKLYDYMQRNGERLPERATGFDSVKSGLGSIYSMPGGLKENVEYFLGKALRIDKSEGQNVVYDALEEFAKQPDRNLPAIFDVLNCPEGCNLGTGCIHDKDIFEINTVMDTARKHASQGTENAQHIDELYDQFDAELNLDDYIRHYQKVNIHPLQASGSDVEEAFEQMDKHTHLERNFDCGACGCDTCEEMARRIAEKVNTPMNCIQKARNDIEKQHDSVLDMQRNNLSNMEQILADISGIKELSDTITNNVESVNEAIAQYNQMASDIDQIAMHINIISLNASVEAARAGQQGRTFAVVAEEIRALAGSSKETVSQTEITSAQATDAISSVNGMIGEIASAVEKAHNNITQISNTTKDVVD